MRKTRRRPGMSAYIPRRKNASKDNIKSLTQIHQGLQIEFPPVISEIIRATATRKKTSPHDYLLSLVQQGLNLDYFGFQTGDEVVHI